PENHPKHERTPCWKRGEFLAIRHELAEGWQPRNGLERQLIDMLAQAHAGFNYWLGQSFAWADLACPQAAGALEMADRFNKMLVRTLRGLRDLRKVPLAVVVQNAGQVNVAQQQANVNGTSGPAGDRPRRTSRRPAQALLNQAQLGKGPDNAGRGRS